MKDRRPITEDDILLTEMLMAKSYGSLKRSVVSTTSETLGVIGDSLGTAVKKHPYATAGAAVGAGILLFGLFRMMGGGPRKKKKDREKQARSDAGFDIVSMILPMVLPYLTAYVEQYLGSMISKKHGR